MVGMCWPLGTNCTGVRCRIICNRTRLELVIKEHGMCVVLVLCSNANGMCCGVWCVAVGRQCLLCRVLFNHGYGVCLEWVVFRYGHCECVWLGGAQAWTFCVCPGALCFAVHPDMYFFGMALFMDLI